MSKVMRGPLGFALLTSALALGCTEKGRSLLLVDVKKDATTIDHVTVVVARNGASLAQLGQAWTAVTTELKLGIYLAKDVSGELNVVACGLSGGAVVAAAGPKTVTVKPGEATPPDMATSLMLAGGASVALCQNLGNDGGAGPDGMAGGGGTGSGGTTGAGGAGGTMSAAGAGGNMGAAGTGAAGAGGTTGAAGAGGAPHVAAWSNPQMAAADPTIDESWPAAAVDSKGNAVVAYRHGTGLWASYYTARTGSWGAPGAIDGRATTAYRPRIAVDKNGTYLVVWQQDPNAANKGVWWSSSTDGKVWSVPEVIAQAVTGSPELSMNADGAAVVAWTEQDMGMNYNDQIVASVRPMTGGTWSAPKILRPAVDGGGGDVAVGMTGKGEAFVTWVQSDGGTAGKYSIWWSQHKAGAFSNAALLESYDAQNALGPAIATNAAGAALLTYVQVDSGNTETMWARRYNPTTGLGAPSMVAQGREIDSYWPAAVVLDEAGFATVAWPFLIQGKYQVHATRGDAANVFAATPTAIESDNAAADDGTDPFDHSPKAAAPRLGVDAAGNVTLLWRKRVDKRFDLWTRSFVKSGAAWGPPKLLETSNANGVESLSLSVGGDGTAVAAWAYENEYDILAATFR